MEFSGQYLTYGEYRLLGGTLDIMPFNLLEFNARKILDGRTFGRLSGVAEIPQEVKLCINEMINSINGYAKTLNSENKNISSESIDGYSVSYASSTQIQEIVKSKQSELEDIMENYLLDSGLLYLGIC